MNKKSNNNIQANSLDVLFELNTVYKNTSLSDFFTDDSVIYTHKLSDHQLQELCLRYKCKVNMNCANLLYRLEKQHYHKYCCPKSLKMLTEHRINRLNLAMNYYKKYYKNAHQKQAKREAELKRLLAEAWIQNRLNHLDHFHINYMSMPSMTATTSTATSEKNVTQQENNSVPLTEIPISTLPPGARSKSRKPVFQFSFNLETVNLNENYREYLEPVEFNMEENSEPLTYSQFVLNKSVGTSTQQNEKMN